MPPGQEVEADVRRFSSRIQFDSGQLKVTLTGEDDAVANEDVCAQTSAAHFVLVDGTEVKPRLLNIAGPYKDTYVRLELAFHTLHEGTYDVRHMEGFAQNLGDTVHVSLESPEYMDGDTPRFAQIVAGELRVTRLTSTHAEISALMETDDGKWISVSANVAVDQPPH
jgi:hypothetical protein